MANPQKWLKFKYPHQQYIDPVFAGRLAALALQYNTPINIVAGFRSPLEQITAYKNSGGHQNKDGSWTGGNGYAARPGASWHEFRLAIDTGDTWVKSIDSTKKTIDQKILTKFGLFKPLTIGNGCTILEDWHIQPVETAGASNKKLYEPEGIQMTLIDFQVKNGLIVDGKIGPKTTAKMLEELEKYETLKAELQRFATSHLK